MPAKRRAAMELTMPVRRRSELRQFAEGRTAKRARSRATMHGLVDALQKGFRAWANAAAEWQRISYEQAGERIEQLSEIQLVVECILSDEWGNCAKRGTRKPEQPSLPGRCTAWEALRAQRADFSAATGARRRSGVASAQAQGQRRVSTSASSSINPGSGAAGRLHLGAGPTIIGATICGDARADFLVA
jgi:hypothetical protein